MSKQSYSKDKGREAENAVVEYLRQCGINAERRRTTGTLDCGDIGGWSYVAIEVKSCKAHNLSGWIDEAVAEAANAGAKFHEPGTKHLLVVKRRLHKLPDRWFGIMELSQAVKVLFNEAEHGNDHH